MSTSASSELVAAFRRQWLPTRHRILHCLRAPVGGLFRHVSDLAIAQARMGHAVGVLCDAALGDAVSERRLDALRHHLELGLLRLPMTREIGPADIGAYRQARRFAQASGADVIHGHGAKGGAYARLASRALKRAGHRTACYYTPHGGSLHYEPASLSGRVYMGVERRLAELTDGLIFESAHAARLFAAHVGTPLCRARVVHNGVRPEDLAPRTLAQNPAEFLFIGELRYLKGIDVLLDALGAICRRRPVRTAVVGEGPDAQALRSKAKALGLESLVHFTGALPVREALALGQTIVVPSRAESLPYVVLEAASAGAPLIASDVGGIPEIVSGTDTLLVPPGDAVALAAAMTDVLNDPAKAEARARRLKAAVATRFTVAAMTSAIVNFYGPTLRVMRPQPKAGPATRTSARLTKPIGISHA